MQCKDIPDRPILEALRDNPVWHTWGVGYSMPTVQNAMPPGTPVKLQIAKMRQLLKRGLVDGCGCGCRGDYHLTPEGLAFLASIPSLNHGGDKSEVTKPLPDHLKAKAWVTGLGQYGKWIFEWPQTTLEARPADTTSPSGAESSGEAQEGSGKKPALLAQELEPQASES